MYAIAGKPNLIQTSLHKMEQILRRNSHTTNNGEAKDTCMLFKFWHNTQQQPTNQKKKKKQQHPKFSMPKAMKDLVKGVK